MNELWTELITILHYWNTIDYTQRNDEKQAAYHANTMAGCFIFGLGVVSAICMARLCGSEHLIFGVSLLLPLVGFIVLVMSAVMWLDQYVVNDEFRLKS